jgi:hypothetical protein
MLKELFKTARRRGLITGPGAAVMLSLEALGLLLEGWFLWQLLGLEARVRESAAAPGAGVGAASARGFDRVARLGGCAEFMEPAEFRDSRRTGIGR